MAQSSAADSIRDSFRPLYEKARSLLGDTDKPRTDSATRAKDASADAEYRKQMVERANASFRSQPSKAASRSTKRAPVRSSARR